MRYRGQAPSPFPDSRAMFGRIFQLPFFPDSLCLGEELLVLVAGDGMEKGAGFWGRAGGAEDVVVVGGFGPEDEV